MITRTSLTPFLLGIAIALLLVFLYSQSIFNHMRHENTLLAIQTLLNYDSRIKQQIVELHHGNKKNYGGLVANVHSLSNILGGFSDSNSSIHLTDSTGTKTLLYSLQQEIAVKKEQIEIFKRENAVLKNTLNYLPAYIDRMILAISSNEKIDPQTNIHARNILNRIISEIFRYVNQSSSDPLETQLTLEEENLTLLSLLPESLHQDINSLFGHTSLIITLHRSIAKSIDAILSPVSRDITSSIYDKLKQDFLQRQKEAYIYRYVLFSFALALLLYLAYVLVRLQRTSNSLKDSLHDLEFHKYAIDRHSIVSITDVKGIILYVNEQFCNISQYDQQELIGQNHRIIKSDVHDDAFFRDMWRTIAKGEIWRGVFANKRKDGSLYWVESSILPRLDKQGKPYQYIGIRTDITAQKEAEHSAALLARFPSENPDPVLRVDSTGVLVYANVASRVILNHWKIKRDATLPDKWLLICNRVLSEGIAEDHEIKIGDSYFSMIFTPVKNEDYVNLYARNITQIKHAEKSLNYQATHDQLTRLFNRFAFEAKLDKTLKKAHAENIASILLYIDLDQFKLVNDTCGHIAGDELLRQISAIFTATIRDNDFLARLGGDEFGVILSNCDLVHGEHIANNILNAINNYRFLWQDKSFEIGASIGLVEIHMDSDSVVSLLGQADIACYAAKDGGRNRLQVFKADDAIAQRQDEMHWVTRIPKALEQNNFLLYAQRIKPLNNKHDNSPRYELLLRLRDNNGDIIPPGAFIPAAERYGLMHSLDMHVISTAFEQLHQFHLRNPAEPIYFSINLSGHSFENQHILEFIPEMLGKYKIDPAHITFEVTETSAIANLTTAIQFISTLKSLGCKFALDDFGSGLSSFAYLKNLPVDYLKIDGIFVKDILDDPIDAAMVRSINQIGHVMNIRTIAEFVETEQIEKRLAYINVDYGQGYGIHRPCPLSEILQFHSTTTGNEKSLA